MSRKSMKIGRSVAKATPDAMRPTESMMQMAAAWGAVRLASSRLDIQPGTKGPEHPRTKRRHKAQRRARRARRLGEARR